MLLAPVQEIREQLGFDDMTDINFAVTMAMHAIEPQLASRLSTLFARGDVTDTFWAPEPTPDTGTASATMQTRPRVASAQRTVTRRPFASSPVARS